MRKKQPLAYKLIMKKNLICFFLFIALGAQAQVIPVGFIKAKGLPSTPIPANLLLYLDATKTDSYGGTGTTWTDLSGMSPSNNATIYGSPTFESGSFRFAKNMYGLTSNSISSLTSGTFIAWVNPSQTQSGYQGIIVSRGSSLATGLNFFTNNSIGYTWNDTETTWGWNSNLQIPVNQWSMVAVTVTSTTATAYLCKASGITTAVNNVAHATVSNLKFYIGNDPIDLNNRGIVGKIGTSMVYSTALTLANITSIFNAQKAAFGL
jgi:hypothetical protein